MKKSERIYLAMLAVVDAENIAAEDKLEVVETLAEEKQIAECVERLKEEEEKNRLNYNYMVDGK